MPKKEENIGDCVDPDRVCAAWSEPDADVLDVPTLLNRCMGKEPLARRLLDKFLEQSGADLEQLGVAVGAGDWEEAKSILHRIKGAASNLSAQEIRGLAAAGHGADLSRHPDPVALVRGLEGALHRLDARSREWNLESR